MILGSLHFTKCVLSCLLEFQDGCHHRTKYKKEFNPMKIVLKTYFSGTIEYQTSKNAITTGKLLWRNCLIFYLHWIKLIF